MARIIVNKCKHFSEGNQDDLSDDKNPDLQIAVQPRKSDRKDYLDKIVSNTQEKKCTECCNNPEYENRNSEETLKDTKKTSRSCVALTSKSNNSLSPASPSDNKSELLFDNRILCITKQQLAQHLSCSVSYINKLMNEGEIPYKKVGRSVRFLVTEIEVWLRKRSRP